MKKHWKAKHKINNTSRNSNETIQDTNLNPDDMDIDNGEDKELGHNNGFASATLFHQGQFPDYLKAQMWPVQFKWSI